MIDPFNNYKYFKTELKNSDFTQNSSFGMPFRSIGINFSWRFGSLKVNQNPKRGVINDDLKQGESDNSQGGR
jgi:ferric enterobactin receptor